METDELPCFLPASNAMNSKVFTQGHALVVGVGADLKCTIDEWR
jgi:hypothetical protein